MKIDSGLVTGTTTTSDEVRVFKGISFAAPPVGELRWKAPQPPARWEGVRKADQFGSACLPNRASASEDCLYINVWTGAKAASERRPVIVWTYGGGFTGGSGSEPRYDGEMLARKGAGHSECRDPDRTADAELLRRLLQNAQPGSIVL